MKSQFLILLFYLLSLGFCIQVWENGFIVDQVVVTPLGPSFISGDLGFLPSVSEASIRHFLYSKLAEKFSINPSVIFIFDRVDSFGSNSHFRFHQQVNNIHVENSLLIAHVNQKTHKVYAITTGIVPGWEFPTEANFSIEEARETIANLIPSPQFKILTDAELVYLHFRGDVKLAYKAEIIYVSENDEEMRSFFYLDAIERTLIIELNRYLNALDREIYTANNKFLLPGNEVFDEGEIQPSSDDAVNGAYYNTGACYDFYWNVFQRDSYDNKGGKMMSSVHYRKNFNNAFWNSEQMVFGDGDGVTFANFTGDLTVVCHELTHAVVEYTAGLVYKDESGALNEGFADIFGFSSFMYEYGSNTKYQWMIGGQCYTPGVEGDALRYMNDPTLDGSSYDYYPGYTGIQDNGGVHWNSGIANLAYVLAVDGGVHPQGKSSVNVTAMGINDAEDLFYNTLLTLGPNAQFADAHAASVAYAKEKWGPFSKQAKTANECWEAVGVPSSFV